MLRKNSRFKTCTLWYRLLSRLTGLIAGGSLFFLSACSLQQAIYIPEPVKAQRPPFPPARLLVFSDPHLFHPDLGIDTPAFRKEQRDEPKLLGYSREILASLVDKLKKEAADFVLVCGDLTKDGEKISHQEVARFLQELEKSGKAVYVVPGNHDVLNSNACRYNGQLKEAVASVTPAEFADIYRSFGFEEALYRDTASLSYIAEPVPGLWLFALDSCGYHPGYTQKQSVSGRFFSSATIRWLKEMLLKAQKAGKAVLGLQHHALLEHYKGQKKYYSTYLLKNNEQVARMLAAYNMSLVFTGHYHAQDTVVKCWRENGLPTCLYDVMTGSTVNYPCPYRLVHLTSGGQAVIKSKYLTGIASYPRHFLSYIYKHQYLYILRYVYGVLKKVRVDNRSAYRLSQQLAKIAMDNFRGDEKRTGPVLSYQGISPWGRVVAAFRVRLLKGMSEDLPPPDNDPILDFRLNQRQKPFAKICPY